MQRKGNERATREERNLKDREEGEIRNKNKIKNLKNMKIALSIQKKITNMLCLCTVIHEDTLLTGLPSIPMPKCQKNSAKYSSGCTCDSAWAFLDCKRLRRESL